MMKFFKTIIWLLDFFYFVRCFNIAPRNKRFYSQVVRSRRNNIDDSHQMNKLPFTNLDKEILNSDKIKSFQTGKSRHFQLLNSKLIATCLAMVLSIEVAFPSVSHSTNSVSILPSVNSFEKLQPSGAWSSFEVSSIQSITRSFIKRASNAPLSLSIAEVIEDNMNGNKQSKGWEALRQKRTIAVKSLQKQGFVSVDTDDVGNQFLSFPWIPDRKLQYKSLSIEQRLVNEVCAGAFGEISKDLLLHAVDTAKVRRQVEKKTNRNNGTTVSVLSSQSSNIESKDLSKIFADKFSAFSDLYAGFPIVLLTSIPQGGVFFFVKRGITEIFSLNFPSCPSSLTSAIPIGLGVIFYWAIRTPAEVIKTQVQTKQVSTVLAAIEEAKLNKNGLFGLWKHYSVMLSLDIPFQIMNFILYGIVTDLVSKTGIFPSIWSRLFCGASCGMVSAAVTCPIDVCKTRIVARDKQQPVISISPDNNYNIDKVVSGISTSTDIALDVRKVTDWDVLQIGEGDKLSSDGTTIVMPNVTTDYVTSITEQLPHVIIVDDTSNATNKITTDPHPKSNNNVLVEMVKIFKDEGPMTLFLGFQQRLLYVGLANGIRLAAYGTSRMSLMMTELDDL